MRGCRTVLSTGHRLFIRNLSASAAPVNLDWHELFEKLFGKALPTRSSEKQLAGSAAFLVDIFKKAVHQKLARNKSLEQKLFIEELQLLDDVGLPKVFEHLIEELSVDHAVLLCTKLPASYLNEGINTLIRLLLERVLENNVDVADQDVLTDKLFELVKLSKGRNCSLSEETRERLLKWLSDSGDALKCNNNLQHLCQENIDLPQVKDGEETRDEHPVRLNSVRQSRILDTKSWIMQELPKASDKVEFIDITTKTRLLGAFYGLGKSAATRKGTDIYIQFEKLELKGMTEGDLKELVDSFTKGVTDVYPSSMDIRRGVEAFKRITQSLKLNTLASYNSLIGHCACHGEIDLAIDLIQTMKSGGLEPCAPSYEPLIKFFAKTLEVSKAEDILRVMKLSGMQPSFKAYTALVAAHAKADNFVRAFNLIEDMPHQNLTAHIYTPIINAYTMKGQISQAVSVFHEMKKKSVKPVGENFSSLINACAARKDREGAEKAFQLFMKEKECSEEDNQKVMAAMLGIYAACGDSKRLEKMISATNIDVSVMRKVKSAMLKGFSETGRNEEALTIYNEIRDEGGYPHSTAFSTLLWSLGNAGQLEPLLALFMPFRKSIKGRSRIFQEMQTSVACSHIVHALISHNHLGGALVFLKKVQLEDAGDVETLCLKVFVEDKGDVAVSKHVHLSLKDKLHFLQGMREELRIQPTRLAYESLLQSCAKENDAHHAEAVLRMMRSDKLQLNVFTYLIMLRISVCTGDTERAFDLLSEMKQTMQGYGVLDEHVKMIILRILRKGHFNKLSKILYQP